MALAPEQITATFRDALGDLVVGTSTAFGMATVVVEPRAWVGAFRFARENAELACDFFTFVSAIDWGDAPVTGDVSPDAMPSEGKPREAAAGGQGEGEEVHYDESVYRTPGDDCLEVFGRVESTVRGHGVTIKARLPKANPVIETLTPVWPGADWHEREMMEMFGVDVAGHPNPVKLYLPDEFEGHPLLKSFLLGARLVKPWPGDVDVEPMPDDAPVLDDAGNVVALATPGEAAEES